MPRPVFANSYKLLSHCSRGYSYYAQYCCGLQQVPLLCLLPWALHKRAGGGARSSVPAGLICLSGEWLESTSWC